MIKSRQQYSMNNDSKHGEGGNKVQLVVANRCA